MRAAGPKRERPDFTLWPPQAADETPHFGAEGAEIMGEIEFLTQTTTFFVLVKANFGPNWANRIYSNPF